MSRYELESRAVQCPYCWEEIELDLDLSAGSQARLRHGAVSAASVGAGAAA
jgi:hypothetical protein